MRYIVSFGRFWYDFIVGDDWIVAVGVIVALLVTSLLAHRDITAWWVLPLALIVLMVGSVWRATHPAAK